MRKAEDAVLEASLHTFERKVAEFDEKNRTEMHEIDHRISLIGKRSLRAADALAEQIRKSV